MGFDSQISLRNMVPQFHAKRQAESAYWAEQQRLNTLEYQRRVAREEFKADWKQAKTNDRAREKLVKKWKSWFEQGVAWDNDRKSSEMRTKNLEGKSKRKAEEASLKKERKETEKANMMKNWECKAKIRLAEDLRYMELRQRRLDAKSGKLEKAWFIISHPLPRAQRA